MQICTRISCKTTPAKTRKWFIKKQKLAYPTHTNVLQSNTNPTSIHVLIDSRVDNRGSETFPVSYRPRQAKTCLRTCAEYAFRSSCACAKYHPGLCSPFIHSIVFNDFASGQGRPWSDCADAQSDLGLHCPHMRENTFSHGANYKDSDQIAMTWVVFTGCICPKVHFSCVI